MTKQDDLIQKAERILLMLQEGSEAAKQLTAQIKQLNEVEFEYPLYMKSISSGVIAKFLSYNCYE